MKMSPKSTFLFLAPIIIAVASCGQRRSSAPAVTFNRDSLVNDIKILSSDSFEGRLPFTRGEERTVDYLAKKFTQLRLEPANAGSFFQDVPMVNIQAIADPTMKLQTPSGPMTLKGYNEYVIWTDRVEPEESLNSDDVVFAGYGVVAPEYNWNDYQGLDVKGKVVMVLVNDPGFNAGDTSLFKGNRMTYYGRWSYKFEEAARQGAKACLVIHETKAAGYPFIVQQAGFNSSRLQLDTRGQHISLCNIIGWITDTAAKKLISAAGRNADSLFAASDKRGFRAVALNEKASTQMKVRTTFNVSKNVLGKITGSKYPGEALIYTAHWDHLGIGTPDGRGDSIYNGALDNASGVATLIELARNFASLKEKPQRTIIFLAVTGEEQGLLGSQYYSLHPVVPVEKTVADINFDGINKLGRSKDLVVVGQGQSELEDVLANEARAQGRYMGAEQHTEAGYYYRSDHFNFAKAGVPSAHFGEVTDVAGLSKEQVQQKSDEYTEKDYHRPSDEYNDSWNLDGALQDLQLYFNVGYKLANSRDWPNWKEGSEFRTNREKSASSRK